MKTIEAVIFDCDGVVVDSDQLQRQAEEQTAASFADDRGLEYDEDNVNWDAMAGWARKKIAAAIFGVSSESDTADAFRAAVVETTIDIACSENTPLIEGIESFVNFLAIRGLGSRLGLATSSHRSIYTQYCKINGIDFFHPDYTVAYGEARDNKPSPGPYLEVARRMDVDPRRTLVVEDSSSGITSARDAGASVLALPTTKPAKYLRAQTGAHIVAENFGEAAHLLRPVLPR